MFNLGNSEIKIPSKLVKLREEIAKAKAAIEALETAPCTRNEALENVRSFIRARAERFAQSLNIAGFASPNAALGELHLLPIVFTPSGGLAQVAPDLLEGLLCSITPASLESFLLKGIDAHLATLPAGVSRDDRRTKLPKLRTELRALEVKEEQMVVELESEGIALDRREDASAEIVLGLPQREQIAAA